MFPFLIEGTNEIENFLCVAIRFQAAPFLGQFAAGIQHKGAAFNAARLFAISLNLRGINNTYLRFKQLAIVDPKFCDIYLNCADAFLILSKFRTLEGFKNDTCGDYINVEEMSKVDKEKLKNSFAPMKELEELIKDKFQLTQFS